MYYNFYLKNICIYKQNLLNKNCPIIYNSKLKQKYFCLFYFCHIISRVRIYKYVKIEYMYIIYEALWFIL